MSLLNDIMKIKRNLKHSDTRVTTADGRQYIESTVQADNEPRDYLPTNHCGYVVDTKPDIQIGCITSNIILGSLDVAADVGLLQKHNVTHILSVAPLHSYIVPTEAKHLCLDILDLPETQLSEYYPAAFKFIESAVACDGCVLIHCNAGVSRSAAMTIAFLMHSRGIPYHNAHAIVKEKRPAINPNQGFIKQLKTFEQKIFNT